MNYELSQTERIEILTKRIASLASGRHGYTSQKVKLHWEPKGATYHPERDRDRLSKQMQRVFDVLSGSAGRKFTLRELADAADCPEASASARFRDLRAMNFPVESECAGKGRWLYWLNVKPNNA